MKLEGDIQALQNNRLKTLNLSGNQLKDEDIKNLSQVLEKNTSLVTLDLSDNQIRKKDAEVLGQMLEKNSTLTTLDLGYNQIKDEGIKALCQGLKKNTSLITLGLQGNQIEYEGAKALSQILEQNTKLGELYLGDNSIGEKGVQALSQGLERNVTLTTLNLSGNAIGDKGIQALSETLQKNTCLTELNLSNTNKFLKNIFKGENIQLLSNALKQNTTLANLHLESNRIGDKSVQVLSEALKNNSSLVILNLRDNNIGKQGIRVLSEALQNNTTLIKLNLSSNPISPDGIHAISQMLGKNTTLSTLNLTSSLLNSGSSGLYKAMEYLKEALENSRALTTLVLQSNEIDDESLTSLCTALKKNTTLTALYLENNKIGDEGAKMLSETLKENKVLATLSLYRNKIGDEGGRAFGFALKKNQSLINLILGDNQISDTGAEALLSVLEDNIFLKKLDLSNNSKITNNKFIEQIDNLTVRNRLLAVKQNNSHLTQEADLLLAKDKKEDMPPELKIFSNEVSQRHNSSEDSANNQWITFLEKHEAEIEKNFIELNQEYEELILQRQQRSIEATKEKLTELQQTMLESARQGISQQLLQQKQELEDSLRSYQRRVDLIFNQSQLDYQAILQTALQPYPTETTFSPEMLEKIGEEIHKQLNAQQWEQQFEQLMQGAEYQAHMDKLRDEIVEQIQQRQKRMSIEINYVQEVQATIKDQSDEMYEIYATKQKILLAQQALQDPVVVKIFYNTIEKVLGADLISALTLASGMIQRRDSKTDTVGRVTGNVINGLIQTVPVFGGVVGALAGMGIQEGTSRIKNYVKDEEYQTVADSILHFKDALAIAEWVARRLAENYRSDLEKIPKEKAAKKLGEKIARVVYNYLKEGKLKPFANQSIAEKVEVIVGQVRGEVDFKTEDPKKNKKSFEESTNPVFLSPSDRHQIVSVTSSVETTQQDVDSIRKFVQNRIFALTKENATIKDELIHIKEELHNLASSLPPVNWQPGFFNLSPERKSVSILTDKAKRISAVQEVQVKLQTLLAENYVFNIECNGKEVHIALKEIEINEAMSILEISAKNLLPILGEEVVSKYKIVDAILTLKTHNPQQAKQLELFLSEVGLVQKASNKLQLL